MVIGSDRFVQIMARLNEAEQARRAAIRDLMEMGAIRSWSLVADLGESLAARYYGVDLERASTAGYDLTTRDGRRVQVKTLRRTPENQRTSMGKLTEPYDVLLGIRLDEDYSPLYAIEAPREVLDEQYLGKRSSWTKKLESDSRVRRIEAQQLLTPEGGANWHPTHPGSVAMD